METNKHDTYLFTKDYDEKGIFNMNDINLNIIMQIFPFDLINLYQTNKNYQNLLNNKYILYLLYDKYLTTNYLIYTFNNFIILYNKKLSDVGDLHINILHLYYILKSYDNNIKLDFIVKVANMIELIITNIILFTYSNDIDDIIIKKIIKKKYIFKSLTNIKYKNKIYNFDVDIENILKDINTYEDFNIIVNGYEYFNILISYIIHTVVILYQKGENFMSIVDIMFNRLSYEIIIQSERSWNNILKHI
jgi:hypothetical protein